MSELFNKQVNAQKENTVASGVHTSSRKPTKKVCDENERKYVEELEKNDVHVKMFLTGGDSL